MKYLSVFIVLGALLSACSKNQEQANPLEVVTAKVKAVGLVSSDAEKEACESEIRKTGGEILYSGSAGLLLVDKSADELKLSLCKVKFTDNAELALATTPRAVKEKTDLPTLLRLLPAEEIGARSFVAANPTYDGRGVIVGILDTGVEIDHPMLRKLPDGGDKVVDFADTSGEGRVTLKAVTVDADGKVTVDGNTYQAKGLGNEAKLGIFPGSTLKYSEDVASVDTFADVAVLSYLNADGKRAARVDTNNNKNFEDDLELLDYAVGRKFTKLGEKKTLTTSLKISDDGAVVSLCFDDGTHGTHVAGISTGYDANGLTGVAPGAKVVAVKIGDNRLSGGSTTTASMLLAIDYAVSKGARILNLSYGIRSGSNLGASAIDAYVDKVAREKGVLFSISAGNEGPGLLTTGTPAGANLAITNGAYVSKETAAENYGYAAFTDDSIWYFSSVGPRLDGGLKPTLLAPGTALAAVPPWHGQLLTYRGTSMASPQTTGGLALILSAAQQGGLPADRVSVTQSVYSSAKNVPGLALVEQGYGLMQVPAAVEALKARKGTLAIEYDVTTTSATSPNGRGKGVYVRSRQLPSNAFTAQVTPLFPPGTSDAEKLQTKTFRLEPSAAWIKTPPSFHLLNVPRTFQITLDSEALAKPGLFSEKITAIDEKTGRVAFVVPVTIVSPIRLNEESSYATEINDTAKVGHTLRYFLDIPAGTTSATVDLSTDGPFVWGQLLDPEGRKVAELRDVEQTIPMSPLSVQAAIKRPGVYELDLVAPPNNAKAAKVRANVKLVSLSVSSLTPKSGDVYDLEIQNNFDSLKVVPRVEIRSRVTTKTVPVSGNGVELPFTITEQDVTNYSGVKFTVKTAKSIYDLMTDYPFRVFDKEKALVASGGLELDSDIDLGDISKLTLGTFNLEIQGAFTQAAPQSWAFELKESRILKSPSLVSQGARVLIERSNSVILPVKFQENCVSVVLASPTGQTVQEIPLCK